MKWKTARGAEIEVADMATEHIRSTLAMLERQHDRYGLAQALLGIAGVAGEIGRLVAEERIGQAEVAERTSAVWIDTFRRELSSRA